MIISNEESETTVEISGRIDTATVMTFENELKPIMELKSKIIVINCRELEYINSSGLRAFLTLQKNVQKNSSQLVLDNMNDIIKEIFDMTGFSEIFTINKKK